VSDRQIEENNSAKKDGEARENSETYAEPRIGDFGLRFSCGVALHATPKMRSQNACEGDIYQSGEPESSV